MSGCTHRTESGAYVRVNTISASMQLERRGCLRPCVRPAGARVGCWELVTVFSVSQRLCFWFAPSPCRSAPARAAPRDGDTREGMFGVPGIAARTWARPRRARDPPCAVFTFAPSKPRGTARTRRTSTTATRTRRIYISKDPRARMCASREEWCQGSCSEVGKKARRRRRAKTKLVPRRTALRRTSRTSYCSTRTSSLWLSSPSRAASQCICRVECTISPTVFSV